MGATKSKKGHQIEQKRQIEKMPSNRKKSPNRKNISKSKKCHEIEKNDPKSKNCLKIEKKMKTKSHLPMQKKRTSQNS